MKKRLTLALVLSSALLAFPTFAAHHEEGHAEKPASKQEIYEIDPVHSSIHFSIRHFVGKVTGSFTRFEGTLHVDREDLTNSSVEARIQVPSVHTANEKRDNHLQQDDYFDAAQYPVMTFKSTAWEKTDKADTFKVTGDLTMHGVTKPVVLDVELLAFGEGPRGAFLSGWEATATLNRTEWGLTSGTPAVGEEVDVKINIEAIRQ